MTPYDRAHSAMDADPENEALRLAVYDRLAHEAKKEGVSVSALIKRKLQR